MAKPWDRGDKESAQAFEAFQLYLAQPSTARHAATVAKEVGKSVGLIERWSARDKWVDRVRAFDAHVALEAAEKLKAQRLKEHEEMRERHRVVGRLALAKATKALARETKEIPIESTVDVYRMVRTGMLLEKSGHEDVAGPGRVKTSGDNAGTGADDTPRMTRLEVVIVGDGGKVLTNAEDLVARMRSFYDNPGEGR